MTKNHPLLLAMKELLFQLRGLPLPDRVFEAIQELEHQRKVIALAVAGVPPPDDEAGRKRAAESLRRPEVQAVIEELELGSGPPLCSSAVADEEWREAVAARLEELEARVDWCERRAS